MMHGLNYWTMDKKRTEMSVMEIAMGNMDEWCDWKG